jgi:cyclophilin family peptidyl-prolyl cis-trans isomerase
VVTGADVGLPPQYAILGAVTKGLRVVERIGKLGNPANERPTRKVIVQRMTVTP